MTAIRRLRIEIDQTGDAAKGVKSIAGSIGKITSLGLAAGKVAVGGIALLTGATIGLGAKLLDLGADAEEMESKFNVVFGTSAPEAAAALDEFGNAVGRSKFDLMEMASTVQDTFVPLGFARDQASDMSIGLTQLAVDVASFNNTLETDTMADFQSAIVGNHETVRKYGIIITQATLDQELMRMGVEGGIKEASEMEKVQARLNIIYAGTTDAQGDAAETAGSWSNTMRALKGEISEGATAMGQELLPVLLPLLANFTEWVRDIMPQAIKVFQEFASDLGEQIGPAMLLIEDAIKRIAEAFGVNTEEVSSTDAVLAVFKTTLDVVVTAVQVAALAFQGVALAVEWIKRAVDDATRGWNDFKRSVREAADAMPDWMIPGSPTPLELGLRGIGSALKDVNLADIAGGPRGGSPGFGGAGTGGVTVNIDYHPAISLADEYEAKEVIAPMIADAVRQQFGVA